MGFSTRALPIETAVLRCKQKKMRCTEWSTHAREIPTLRIAQAAVKAEISDHDPPRVYFTLGSGNFACFEEGIKGKRQAVMNPPLINELGAE